MKDSNKTILLSVIQNIKRDMADFSINEFELMDRVTVKLDEEQFDAKEDHSVWMQKKGKAPWVCEVYFDGVWCCDLHEQDSHDQLRNKFFKGFLNGYEYGKIRLNRWLAKIEDERKEEEEKKEKEDFKKSIESLPSSTPEEKMAKDVIKEIAKEEETNATATSNTIAT